MNSIDKLIKVIESINLEITDNNIKDLQNELSKLETLHGTNKIVIYFLKMHTFLYDLCFKSAYLKRYNLKPKRKVLDYEPPT